MWKVAWPLSPPFSYAAVVVLIRHLGDFSSTEAHFSSLGGIPRPRQGAVRHGPGGMDRLIAVEAAVALLFFCPESKHSAEIPTA